MRVIGISTHSETKRLANLTITKDIPYISYNDNYLRVNTDEETLTSEEKELFPKELTSDDVSNYSTRKINENKTTRTSYWSTEKTRTMSDLMETLDLFINNNMGGTLSSTFLYKIVGKISETGEIKFDEGKTLAFKLGQMLVPAITVAIQDLDVLVDVMLEEEYLSDDIILNTNNKVELRHYSDIDISVIKNEMVIITCRDKSKDVVKFKTLIESILSGGAV